MPNHGVTLHLILYTSRLAADQSFDAVAAISRESRLGNARCGIRSVLLFDGHRFAQYIVGPAVPVRELMQRIRVDPRHTGIEMLYDDEARVDGDLVVDPDRRAFRLAYCGSADFDLLDRADRCNAAPVLGAFQVILDTAYLSD